MKQWGEEGFKNQIAKTRQEYSTRRDTLLKYADKYLTGLAEWDSPVASYWHAKKWIEQGDLTQARAHFVDYMKSIRSEGLILGRAEIAKDLLRRGLDGTLMESQK